MTSPLTDPDLDRISDNHKPRCSGCGATPRREYDGLAHWYHQPGCPVARRIFDTTEGDE